MHSCALTYWGKIPQDNFTEFHHFDYINCARIPDYPCALALTIGPSSIPTALATTYTADQFLDTFTKAKSNTTEGDKSQYHCTRNNGCKFNGTQSLWCADLKQKYHLAHVLKCRSIKINFGLLRLHLSCNSVFCSGYKIISGFHSIIKLSFIISIVWNGTSLC